MFRRTNGEEKGRDGCRVPIPWTSDAASNYGFSAAAGADAPWLPQPEWWGDFAADAQENDPSSILALYRAVMGTRDQFDPQDAIEWVLPDDPALVAFRRGGILVVMNMSRSDATVPSDVLGSAQPFLQTDGGNGALVPANSTVWFR